MEIQAVKRFFIIFILVITFIGASQNTLSPCYTDVTKKNSTIWVVIIKNDGTKSFIKMTIPTKELKNYTWIGYYKNMDIYQKNKGVK